MSNNLRNSSGDGSGYQESETASGILVHDTEAVGLLTDILTELKKANFHLKYLSGLDVEDYNVGDSE